MIRPRSVRRCVFPLPCQNPERAARIILVTKSAAFRALICPGGQLIIIAIIHPNVGMNSLRHRDRIIQGRIRKADF